MRMFNVQVRVSLWLGAHLGPRGLTTAHYAFRGKGRQISNSLACVCRTRGNVSARLSFRSSSQRHIARKEIKGGKSYIYPCACVLIYKNYTLSNLKRFNNKSNYHYLIIIKLRVQISRLEKFLEKDMTKEGRREDLYKGKKIEIFQSDYWDWMLCSWGQWKSLKFGFYLFV